jgi:hypothetical protein
VKSTLLSVFCFWAFVSFGQDFQLSKGTVVFFSSAPLEDIRAENKKLASFFNPATNEIAFSIPIREFMFEKSLMREHFNDKYMESHKYPNATFQGHLLGFNIDDPSLQQVLARGKLTIHGITRSVQIPGEVQVVRGGLEMKSVFMVKLADYEVKIPSIMFKNIAEEVEVSLQLIYHPYAK